jgi:hypothetical protein
MNQYKTSDRRSNNSIISMLSIALILTISIELTGCKKLSTPTQETRTIAIKDVVGLTEAQLRAKYPELKEIERSFSILVSKNLHPYHPPATNKLLRFGREYLVVELKDGRVIALHRVSG